MSCVANYIRGALEEMVFEESRVVNGDRHHDGNVYEEIDFLMLSSFRMNSIRRYIFWMTLFQNRPSKVTAQLVEDFVGSSNINSL